jgi:beta-galactosidase
MTRGEYITDRSASILDSYDDQVLPWGLSHRDAWKQVAERPFVAGTMVWTGFDYRGEPQPLQWPATGSSFGILDLCGFPKAAFYIHQAQWITDRPLVHLVPPWNWAGSEGKPIKVMVTSNAERVELRLNGKSVGEGPVDKYEMATFEVPYEAGKLEAVASNGGKEVARFAEETAGPPAALRLLPDRTSLAGDGYDAQPITVEVVDAKGRVVPDADSLVHLTLTGPGAIIGLNNGDPTNHEPEKGNRHQVFHGLAQVVVQSGLAGHGKLTLRATADGLAAGELAIDINPTAPRPAVPVIANPPVTLSDWKRSPITVERPDPNQQVGETDMNSWSSTRPGGRQVPFRDGIFAIYRIHFTPRPGIQQSGGRLVLRDVFGKAQVWIDGKLAAEKSTADRGTMTVPLPSGNGERTVSVLIEAATPNDPAGLGGIVTVE